MKIKFISILSVIVLLSTSCEKDTVSSIENSAIKSYSEIVSATYEDSYSEAVKLQTAIKTFTATPTSGNFELAKSAWKAARIPYGQTEAFRFYGGPIDNDEGPEGLINGWPMDESFLDYVEGNLTAGLINNPTKYPTITKELLESLNEKESETQIMTGYHAIEFLLWGQDLNANGPGQRAFTDYSTAKNADRRKAYLQLVADLLVENLAQVKDEWKTGGKYRTEFEKTESNEVIGNIFRGIGTLSKGELAGERMTVALANKDQEDEHSCFSDNTHIDIQMNFKGIQNVYVGKYTRVNGQVVTGTSFSEVVKAKDTAKDAAVLEYLTKTETDVALLVKNAPFDKLISAGDPNNIVKPVIENLKKLSDRLVDAAFALGIQVNTDLPE
ncbi:MAG: imelysin family protein [Emticicia sp.]|nr:imelysin family protein [Emticicia sp.]